MRFATTGLITVLGLAALTAGPARAQQANDPTFGSRNDRPDGSVALTIGRRLPTELDAKFGLDANLSPEPPTALADSVLANPAITRSTGAIWGSMNGPAVAPIIFDKTSLDARIDPSQEKGQVAATLSRTVPLSGDVSITLQDKYSLTQSLQSAGDQSAATVWQSDRSLRLKLENTDTTLSAGIVTSSADNQVRNRISAEQRIIGALNVTTTITDPGSAASNKSIAAGFKHTW